MKKRVGESIDAGDSKRASLEKTNRPSPVLTRSRLKESKIATVLNSPWTNEKKKKVRAEAMRKKVMKKTLDGENKENIMEQMQLVTIHKTEMEKSEKKNTDQSESSKFNLKHWTQVYNKHLDQIKEKTEKIESISTQFPTNDEFWITELERAKGESALFIGKKSKLTQFGNICKDPTNDKFKVEKEDDIKAFWDGMVFPSIDDFIKRSDWLIEAGESSWLEAIKSKNPHKPISLVPKPSKTKPIKTTEQIEKDKKQKEKLNAAKKAAEQRRAEMRKKMLEMKRKNAQS